MPMPADRQMLRLLLAAALIGWSGLISGIAWLDFKAAEENIQRLAVNEARANLNKDLAFRLWGTSHGGVYVPADERTPPNPALDHLPQRDITGYQGIPLTLMNPAYMLRQVMEEHGRLYGIKGRIVSFKPLNPNNAPDAWEAAALNRFEAGEREVTELGEIAGESHLRLMRAMVTETGCLKCHAFQGYQEGDLRGGVAVAVPMAEYLAVLAAERLRIWRNSGLIWLLGLGGIMLLSRQLQKRLQEHERFKRELSASSRQLASAHAELRKFAEIAAHHLQEPTRRLLLYADRLEKRLDGQQPQDQEAGLALTYIRQGAARLHDLVRDIQQYLAVEVAPAANAALNPEPVIRKVLERFAPRLKEVGGEATLTTLPPLPISEGRLRELFAIILDNAILYHRADQPLLISIHGRREEGHTRIMVADNGQGIPAPYRERVLGVFERLSAGVGGTGIGLAIARRIMEGAGGSLRLAETPGGGVTVVLEFPGR